ncbi:hypothetical protein BSQ39_08825 [Loigolactobacillus backii]|uniref:5-bromo-4-chloroindolyl phosphate hydrolysis family protein n=1 Tax=Loigolactobacillus backii TaxID=375175 RepID=UPI000C1CB4A4|nr:5-bromo-4-chloroindolyl phosphate hydrolysis family protein [Loigolactobacillus backii]PIO83661.1 hypothetical protein BSQ39_08825 [Loigolactobacillus backii]
MNNRKKSTRYFWLLIDFFSLIVSYFLLNELLNFKGWISLIGALLITAVIVSLQPKRAQKVSNKSVPSDQLMAHYKKSGMSERDIDFFRGTMADAKAQIDQLAKNMQRVPKLKAIELHDEPVKVSQATFKALVAKPAKLHLAADFLYRHLPTLVDLTTKYIQISQHEVKDKDTYVVLDKSATLITDLAQQLKKDYAAIVADDLEDLDVDMSLAKKALEKAKTAGKESNLDE